MLGEYSTTTTVSCGETGDDGMDGVVSEVTTGELIEEEEAEVDNAVDVSSDIDGAEMSFWENLAKRQCDGAEGSVW